MHHHAAHLASAPIVAAPGALASAVEELPAEASLHEPEDVEPESPAPADAPDDELVWMLKNWDTVVQQVEELSSAAFNNVVYLPGPPTNDRRTRRGG
jgi:hypothetical protein